MGTFHDNKDALHGITVVAFAADTVYVGRCHDLDETHLQLLDVDLHSEGQGGKTNLEYLERAAKFGVWKKHDRFQLPLAEVSEVKPLGDYYQGLGKSAIQRAPLARPSRESSNPVGHEVGDSPVTLTDAAAEEVKRLLEEEPNRGQGLRLGVSGGGCSGLVYKVVFDDPQEGDVVVPQEGFEVLLDRKSVIYLRGVVLDFQQGLSGRGFQFQNPNASNTCGCGESFAL
jgi:iron-sulfur cluster assembly protein